MAVRGGILAGKRFVVNQISNLLPKEARAAMRGSTLSIARELRNTMKKNAPRDTGTLRKAIKAKRAKIRGKGKWMIAADVIITRGKQAKNDAWYWFLVEYGTIKKEARPFARPAIALHRRTYRRKLKMATREQVFKQLVKRAKRQREQVRR